MLRRVRKALACLLSSSILFSSLDRSPSVWAAATNASAASANIQVVPAALPAAVNLANSLDLHLSAPGADISDVFSPENRLKAALYLQAIHDASINNGVHPLPAANPLVPEEAASNLRLLNASLDGAPTADDVTRRISSDLSYGSPNGSTEQHGPELKEALAKIREAIAILQPNLTKGSVFDGSTPRPLDPAAIDSARSYGAHRLILRAVAVLTGAVYSLRPAGPALTDKLIAQAADRRAVFSDVDETLADSNAAFSHRLSPEMVQAVQAVVAAGKTIDFISDRQENVIETLSTIPPQTRAGMHVAVDMGGRIYRYDAAGEPVLVYREPEMSAEVKDQIGRAAAATKARLAEVRIEQFTPTEKDSNPAEIWNPYTHVLRFKVGSTEEQVSAAAAIMQQELARAGSDLQVRPRMAKDPSNAPYLLTSINSKAKAARYLALVRGLPAKDILNLGDSMYAPSAAQNDSRLARFGRRVSGRAIPLIGNGNDAQLEKGAPGSWTFAVGGLGDPRTKGLVVLAGKGPPLARRVLLSVASKPAGPAHFSYNWPDFARSAFHGISFLLRSFKPIFFDLNIENWREYKARREAAAAGRNGDLSVSDAPAFFIHSRFMGLIGRFYALAAGSGGESYATDHVIRESIRVFDRFFDHEAVGPAARDAFIEFIGRSVRYNPRRSSSNFRKQIRKALHSASLLAPEMLKDFFDGLLPPESNALVENFQRGQQGQVLADFRKAVEETVGEEAGGSGRVIGVVLRGSFARGGATESSDLDFNVLTADGRSDRVPSFLSRLEKRWSGNPASKTHPINGPRFGFVPLRSFLLRVLREPYQVISPDALVERALSPPLGWYAGQERPEAPTRLERLKLAGFRAVLRATLWLTDLSDRAAGRPVTTLDEKTRSRALAGWLAGRTLYVLGSVFAWAIAFPIFAQETIGRQGFTNLISLGALAAISLSSFSGLIADRLSLRNASAFNNAVRLAALLALPVLVFYHSAAFWPMMFVVLANSWNNLSTFVIEDKLLPVLAGPDAKRLSVLNAAANIHFVGLNVLLGIFLFAGHWLDVLMERFGSLPGLSTAFIVSGALSAAGAVVQWLTIPNIRLRNPATAPTPAAAAPARQGRKALLWGLLLTAGGISYSALYSIAPQFATLPLIGASLIGLAATSPGFRRLWKNPVLRTGTILGMLFAFVSFPLQSILIPFVSKDLNGGAELQGQLQGALFFGQLLAASTMLNLPDRWNMVARVMMLGSFGVWLAFYLFPHNALAAAAGLALGLGLYAISDRLSNRGWLRYAPLGLLSIAAPIFFWGNVPILLLSILLIGLVSLPNKITVDTIMQSEAKTDPDTAGRTLSARSALTYIATSFGYASFGAMAGLFHPAFPTTLWPVLIMFSLVGALFWAARYWLDGRLAASDLKSSNYSREKLAKLLAARIKAKGIKAVISDYDGTLEDKTPDNKAVPASNRVAALIDALRQRGVIFVVSTNHFFTGDDNSMTHLLGDRLGEKTRAGMLFVAQSGSRIYEYGPDGATPAEPAWTEAPFDEAEQARIKPAFERAAAEIGLAPADWKLFQFDSRTLIELHNHQDRLGALQAALSRANAENGWGYLVQTKPMPTMRHVPYIQFMKGHKGTGTRRAFEMLQARGLLENEEQVLILGDDFKTDGNDLYMAQALPGAMAISVGKSSDERQRNVLQSEARGAAATQDLLERLASLLDKR